MVRFNFGEPMVRLTFRDEASTKEYFKKTVAKAKKKYPMITESEVFRRMFDFAISKGFKIE